MGMCSICNGGGSRTEWRSGTGFDGQVKMLPQQVSCGNCSGGGSVGGKSSAFSSGDPVTSLIGYFSILPMAYAGMLSQQNNVEGWNIAIICFVAYVVSILICNFTPIRWIFSTVVFAFGLCALLIMTGIGGAILFAITEAFIL